MAQNSSFNCTQYDTLESITGDASIDFTALFIQCPETCLVANGSGNPDIAGIGALISYGIMTILNVLFGVFMPFVPFLLSQKGRDKFSKLFMRFYLTQAYFAIPLLIASFVLIFGNPTVFEIEFLSRLTPFALMGLYFPFVMVFSLFMIQSVSGDIFVLFKGRPASKLGIPGSNLTIWLKFLVVVLNRLKLRVFSYGTDTFLLPAIVVSVTLSSALFGVYGSNDSLSARLRSEYSKADCHPNYDTPHLLTPYSLSFTVVIATSFSLSICLFIYLSIRLRLSVGRGCTASLCLIWIFSFMVYIAYTFNSLIGGTEAQSSLISEEIQSYEWGFGQVLAVCVWIPSGLDILLWVFKAIRRRKFYWKSCSQIKATLEALPRKGSWMSRTEAYEKLYDIDEAEKGKAPLAETCEGSLPTAEVNMSNCPSRPSLRRHKTM